MNLTKQLLVFGTGLVLGGNVAMATPSPILSRSVLPRQITLASEESDTFGIVAAVIAKLMGVDVSEVKKSSILVADLGMDSLDFVEVVMECEKQLSVSSPDEMWNNFGKNSTVKDLVDAFDSLLGNENTTSKTTVSFNQAKTNVKVKGTPYEMLVALLEAGGYPTADVSLETRLPYEVIESVMPSLRKNMKIKDKVELPALPVPEASMSEVLTAVMHGKYEGKSNKNADFEKIRYSLNSTDFDQYIATYPKSKHIAEVETRRKCAEMHEYWLKASEYGSRLMHQAFIVKCYNGDKDPLEAPEGYESLVNLDYQRARAIANWYDMMRAETNATNGTIDCSIYVDYLEEFGKYSCLTDVATDSLNSCLERAAWHEADMENSIASYQSYVDEFPDGNHVRYAKAKLDDWKAWHTARESDTYSGYCDYYEEFPEGDSVVLAIPYMQQKEQQWWDNAQKKNTLAAYDDFIDRFPKGYYSSEAKNRAGEMRLDGVKGQKETIKGLEEIGKYSQLGYSLIGMANLDKYITMTVSLIGKTGQKVVLEHGKSQWVKVKNGKYKILVEASHHESWWGNLEVESGIYIGNWYSVTKFNYGGFDLDRYLGNKPYDEEAESTFAWEAIFKVFEEKAKLEE